MKHIIGQLSKSSPYAVATPKSEKDIFDYLHIETDIEKEYVNTLERLTDKKIIFLCGSSGDGKSAIITRSQKRFEDSCEFHLDATHSFSPHETALERLDKVFDKYKQSEKSLVIGINIGILINYSKHNKNVHFQIKNSIEEYLKVSKKEIDNTIFINFEDYPKFENLDNKIGSKFLKDIFQKVTSSSSKNPFYQAYLKGKEKHRTLLCDNYELLSKESVQEKIIELIVLSHLKYNQFLTARAILDFIYTLLSDEKLLSDTLFENHTNLIIKNIANEDPCLKRNEVIDRFVIKQTNQEEDTKLHFFCQALNLVDKNLSPCNLLRIFYLLNSQDISNNYHKQFFQEGSLVEKYIRLLISHNRGEDSNDVKSFYKELKNALFLYINRNRLNGQKELIILESNDTFITIDVEIRRDKKKITSTISKKLKSFECYIFANEKIVKPIDITFNIYKMLQDINSGYRPNQYDKNSLIIFNEFVERIIDEVKVSNNLIINSKDGQRYVFRKIDEDEIEVDKI